MGQNVWGEKVTQRVHFSFSELKVGTRTGDDGVVYSTFSYPGIEEESSSGYPALPVKFVRVDLPHDAQNITLSQKQLAVTSHVLDQKVYPAQREVPMSLEKFEKTFCPCLSDVYESNNQFPSEQVNITDISCAGQGYRSVGLVIYPIVYHPTENKYDFCEDVEFTITYSLPSLKARAASRANRTRDIGLPFYEYCIITNRELKDAFTRLVAWKSEKGMSAGVVCKEDILNNANIVGDTVSAIYDDAGKIRQYLQYAYASGITKYVLFGGGDVGSILPIRYGTGTQYAHDNGVPEKDHIPSDLYFSELNTNWNVDGDYKYGERSPFPKPNGWAWDLGAELCVGRILCTNAEEIQNYTDKLLRYELNPGNGDYSYLKKALYTQVDYMQETNEQGEIAAQLHDIFPIDTIFSESPSPYADEPTAPYGNDVIAEMNNRYGFVSWGGHGHPNGISVKSNGHAHSPVYAITSVPGKMPGLEYETANSLADLTNKDYPMVAYSISCIITPFDLYKEYTEFPNMGQSFTLGKDYGGPLLVGNTREGFSPSSHLQQMVFNEYLMNNPMVGPALNYAKVNFFRNSSGMQGVRLGTNIIGCPNIRIWTDIPSPFNATVTYQSNHPILSCNTSRTSAEAGARDITQVNETSTTAVFDPSTQPLAWENGGNLLITLTGKNCLPQILPLKLQDVTLQGTHYAIVKDVTCGKNVRNGSQGDVVFDENADYTFETKGTIRLDKGVKVNLGAKLKVIPSEINY
ncbi:MAG: hypothetical protein J5524_02595 [Bacteroidaceae bacterium]|nr:hypothetical protein [Bacteroidaceae bacterium]